jgi:flagellar biosynthesis chaperone FliJ
MARTIGLDALEQKIEKAQSDVVKAKKKYDAVVAALKDLMDKRDMIKRDEIISAIMKSNKSYDQILRFIQQADQGNE